MIVTLRPDADHSRNANPPYGGYGTDWQTLSDNSDSTAIILYASGGSKVEVHMSGIGALGGNQRILQVRPIARIEPYNTSGFSIDFQLYHNDGSGYHYLAWNGDAGGVRYVYGGWAQSTPDGYEWSVGRVNDLRVNGQSGGGGTTSARLFEFYAEVDIRHQPTIANVGPSGTNPGATRTPTASWSFGDPDGLQGQMGYRVKVFSSPQGNPDVGGAVYDSGDRGGGEGNHTITTSLANGTYYVYVKVSKDFRGGHWWSAWGGNTFTISDAPIIPTGVSPTQGSTVTTSKPTLGATVVQSALATPARIEWQLATDSGFTANVRTILEGAGDARVSGGTTEIWPGAVTRIAQGVWYIRARSRDNSGQYSGYTASQTFTVSHAPAPANLTPTGDITLNYAGTGTITFDWDFTDPDPAGDVQTAFQVEISRNDTAAIVQDTTKTVSGNTFYTYNIPVGQKDMPLRWRVKLWDQDDIAGAWSAYQLFRTSDIPGIAITYPADSSTTDNARPTFTWNTTLTGGRTQVSYRVRVNPAGGALGATYDSTVVTGAPGAAQTHTPPSNILLNGVTYEVRVDVTDNVALTNYDINTFLVSFDQPRPVAVTVDDASYQMQGAFIVSWTDGTKDSQWLRYLVYHRRVGTVDWELVATYTNVATSYSFYDQLIPAGDEYEWAVTQIATRFGIEVESAKPGENRVPSLGFETGTIGWRLVTTGGSAQRITSDGATGTASVELIDGSATDIVSVSSQTALAVGWSVDDIGFAPGESVEISMDLKITVAGTVPVVQVVFSDAADTQAFAVTDLPFNTWQTFTAWFTVPLGKTYGYIVVSPTDPGIVTGTGSVRVDNIRIGGQQVSASAETEDYWLIDPNDYTQSVRLFHVTGDSFTEEFEEAFLPIIGRGRKHEIGTRFGYNGTLSAQLFDRDEATARAQRLALEVLRNERKALYLRNPFGDIFQVAAGAIQISRTPGVGKREFASVTIPYQEIA